MDPQDGDDSNLGWASIPLRGHWSEWRCSFIGLNVHPIPPSGGNYFDYIIDRNDSTHAIDDVMNDVYRLPAELAVNHRLIHDLDIGSPPSASGQITAGSTGYFQAWFRDPIGGGSAFNLSDGRVVYFIP